MFVVTLKGFVYIIDLQKSMVYILSFFRLNNICFSLYVTLIVLFPIQKCVFVTLLKFSPAKYFKGDNTNINTHNRQT